MVITMPETQPTENAFAMARVMASVRGRTG